MNERKIETIQRCLKFRGREEDKKNLEQYKRGVIDVYQLTDMIFRANNFPEYARKEVLPRDIKEWARGLGY